MKKIIILSAIALIALSGCRTTRGLGLVQTSIVNDSTSTRDSVTVRDCMAVRDSTTVRDSVSVKDSTFILQKGDSLIVHHYHWKTVWREKASKGIVSRDNSLNVSKEAREKKEVAQKTEKTVRKADSKSAWPWLPLLAFAVGVYATVRHFRRE